MITYSTDKLQKVLLSGGCEQRNVPSGYTQVAYLGSNSQAYIDTGIEGDNNNLEIGCTFSYSNKVTYGAVYGNYVSDNDNSYRIILGSTATNTVFINVNTQSGSNGTNTHPCAINTISKTTIKRFEYTVNSNAYQLSQRRTGTTNNNKICLFSRSLTNPNTTRDIGLKVYDFYIKDNNVLVCNLIPCRRNSDNELGMYDTVTGTFLTNAGTGDFTAGADVVPTPDTPIDIVCNNGVIKVSPNLFNKNNRERISGFFPSTGSDWKYYISAYSNRIPCLPNTTYTARYNGNSLQAVLGFGSISSDDVPTQNTDVSVTNSVRQASPTIETPITITTGANDKWLIVAYNIADPQNTDMADNLQIEQGTTATTYMPYGQIYTDGTQEVVTDSLGNTANAERLLAVGNYKDTQEVLTGTVSRNVGIKVFDGTETFSTSTTYGEACYIMSAASYWGANKNIAPICTHFLGKPMPTTTESDYTCFFNTSGHFYFRLEDNTVATLKTFLADQYANGTPVIVVYPLATPTTDQVTPQLLADNSVTQTAGSIDNLPIESSTIVELKKRCIGDKEVERVYIGDNLVFGEPPVYNFVDLGLPSGTLWAKGNIVKDANGNYSIGNETDYGCYFSWGNVEGHNEDEGYNFGTDNEGYVSTPGNLVSADIASNDAAHDAALATLGGSWRMPTKTEFLELYDNCTSVWTTKNGVNGMYFTSKNNGNSIFFPATGLYTSTSLSMKGTIGYYWSSSYYSDLNGYYFYLANNIIKPQDNGRRRCGRIVRAVK